MADIRIRHILTRILFLFFDQITANCLIYD